MPITIGSNITSLQAQRAFSNATDKVGTSSERLASGMRINKASDDAAGLAISEQLNADSKVFTQAINNVSDGISYFSIAEGAINELKNIVIRQTELAEQSANGTYSTEQREALDTEFQALESEYNRLVESTSFNGRKVFSAEDGAVSIQAGYGEDGVLLGSFGNSNANAEWNTVQRVSDSYDGSQGNGHTGRNAISADGRFVTFTSEADNLVAGDTNGVSDVFLRDRLTNTITRVSVSSSGSEGNAEVEDVALSADGRYVAFSTASDNLISGDTNGVSDVFVHDTYTGTTRRISIASDGTEGHSSSSSTDSLDMSADGRYIVFKSAADNLVAGDTNGDTDIFVHDLLQGTTVMASTDSSDTQGNGHSRNAEISADGRYVSFSSEADLDPTFAAGWTVFRKDLVSGETVAASVDMDGLGPNHHSYDAAISGDGRYVAIQTYASDMVADDPDTNGAQDIYLRDMLTGTNTKISKSTSGVEGDSNSFFTTISGDGRYVVFTTTATNLDDEIPDPSGWDTYIHDTVTHQTKVVTTDKEGAIGGWDDQYGVISQDGRYIVFENWTDGLTEGGSNGKIDSAVVVNPFLEKENLTRNQWLKVDSQAEALLALDHLDTYLSDLNTASGQIGSVMSRFEVASANLLSMNENYKAAEGRIVDADIAQEAADLARTQILQQASASVLAQANQQPSLALQLLG